MPGNIGRGETTFLGTGTVFAYEKLWLLLSYRFLRLMSGSRKYFFEKIQSYIYLAVFNLTQSFILPCRRNLRHSIAECLIEITIIYNNNTTVASGDEPFHRCDSPKIPGFFKSLFIFFSLFSTLQGFQSSVLLSL